MRDAPKLTFCRRPVGVTASIGTRQLEELNVGAIELNRDDLAHLLRAAWRISSIPEIFVLGSQSILAWIDADALPLEVTRSVEADLAFADDPDGLAADFIDGAIGELSMFHEQFGYYAQGVTLSSAVLPRGWENRAVIYRFGDIGEARALCLEPHDLSVAKLVAGREKDYEFVAALLRKGLLKGETLRSRARLLPLRSADSEAVLTRIQTSERMSST